MEVYFLGETTLENGLTVGARVELEGQTSADQIDAVFAYFSGSFGEVRFGDTFEALAQLCYTVPSASSIFGADSPLFNFSNAGIAGYSGTNGTCYGIDDKSTKLVYFSPSFGGFQFAASFTPDNTEDTRNTLDGAGTRFQNNTGELSENSLGSRQPSRRNSTVSRWRWAAPAVSRSIAKTTPRRPSTTAANITPMPASAMPDSPSAAPTPFAILSSFRAGLRSLWRRRDL